MLREDTTWKGRYKLEDIKETGHDSVSKIHLVQDRDQWWGVENVVMNFRGREILECLSNC
jgi:hypothetical protein